MAPQLRAGHESSRGLLEGVLGRVWAVRRPPTWTMTVFQHAGHDRTSGETNRHSVRLLMAEHRIVRSRVTLYGRNERLHPHQPRAGADVVARGGGRAAGLS